VQESHKIITHLTWHPNHTSRRILNYSCALLWAKEIGGPPLATQHRHPTLVTLQAFASYHPIRTTPIMTDDKHERKSRVSDPRVQKLQLEDGYTKREPGRLRTDEIKEESASSNSQSPSDTSMKSASQSPVKHEKASQSPFTGSERHEAVLGGEITIKQEPGQPPKLSRSTSQRMVARPQPVFNDYEDKTKEAREGFEVIPECSYSSKYIGSSEHDSMDCDCAEEWGRRLSTSTYIAKFV